MKFIITGGSGRVGQLLARLACASGDGPFVSWIHKANFMAAIRILIERKDISRFVNLAAPNRILPGRLLARVFPFMGSQWGAAAQDLCQRVRK